MKMSKKMPMKTKLFNVIVYISTQNKKEGL
jgi:hypothetical protein